MSLRLTTDKAIPVQAHLDELSIRLGRLLAILVLMMIICWNFIDELILRNYISLLSPCTDCVAVYSPTEWVSLRWLSILLLGICLTIPFFSREVLVFCSPGMLSYERKWLKQLLFVGSTSIIFVVSLTLFVVLPFWFLSAEKAGFVEGVSPSYSAAAMLEFALIICYIEIIVFLSVISAILLRRYGIAEGEEKASWQFRIHGVSIFLMWLIIPSDQDTLLTLGILMEFILVELSFSKISRSAYALPSFDENNGILDSEARLRRIGIVGCSCCDVVPVPQNNSIPKGMVFLPIPNFCISKESTDLLIGTVMQLKLTDVIITGCGSETKIDERLIQNLEYLNCHMRTLSLIDFSSLRIADSKIKDIDFMIRLAVENDPWKLENSYERIFKILSEISRDFRPEFAYWTESITPPFGTDLSPNEILITSTKEPTFEIINDFKKLGVNLLQLQRI